MTLSLLEVTNANFSITLLQTHTLQSSHCSSTRVFYNAKQHSRSRRSDRNFSMKCSLLIHWPLLSHSFISFTGSQHLKSSKFILSQPVGTFFYKFRQIFTHSLNNRLRVKGVSGRFRRMCASIREMFTLFICVFYYSRLFLNISFWNFLVIRSSNKSSNLELLSQN